MGLRRPAVVAALCGTAVVAGWLALARADLGLFPVAAAPIAGNPILPAAAEVAPIAAAKSEDAVSHGDADIVDVALPVPVPSPEIAPEEIVTAPPPETTPEQVAVALPPEAAPSRAEPAAPVAAFDDCQLSEGCIDGYLWAVYRRTPKQDTIKVSERVKVTVKSKGKTRTITKTVVKLVDEDFAWKDPKAAEKAGMPLMQYVIDGMERSFKIKLYHALRAMEDAGLEPGITSAFRDDYRQAIASGKKAASDSSYHGGSRRGGYGHGLAADLVSVKGETRAARWISSEILWKWIDEHGPEFGVARPYLDRDPPHVGPIDGKEYADKRGLRHAKLAQAHKRSGSPEGTKPGKTKGAKTASR